MILPRDGFGSLLRWIVSPVHRFLPTHSKHLFGSKHLDVPSVQAVVKNRTLLTSKFHDAVAIIEHPSHGGRGSAQQGHVSTLEIAATTCF